MLCRARYAKDLDRALFPGVQGGPLMHIIAAKAVCLKEALEPAFADYQRQIVANAKRLAPAARRRGFRLVSGGTDNHLMLVDVFSKGLTGKVAEAALGKAGITVNKNAIPFDQNPPMVASGIRIGTPAVTTRGMREPEMDHDRRVHRARARAPDDDGALAWCGKSKRCAGSSRCIPEASRARRRAARPPDARGPAGSLARAARRSSRARAARDGGRAVAAVFADGGVLLAEAGTGTGKTLAYLVPRSSAASACSSPPARRTCRNRSTSRTSRCSARRSACRSPPPT